MRWEKHPSAIVWVLLVGNITSRLLWLCRHFTAVIPKSRYTFQLPGQDFPWKFVSLVYTDTADIDFTLLNFRQQFYFPAQSLGSIFCLSLAVITHICIFSKLFKHCIAHIKSASPPPQKKEKKKECKSYRELYFSTSESCDKILICSLVLEGDTEHVINYSTQNMYMNKKWLPAVS